MVYSKNFVLFSKIYGWYKFWCLYFCEVIEIMWFINELVKYDFYLKVSSLLKKKLLF